MLDILTFRQGKKPALSTLLQAATCPACGHHVAVSFYDGGKAPLTTLAWPKSPEQAQAMEKLPLEFVRCVDCGHVFNKAFCYANVPYSDKPNLMYNQGALWQTHLQQAQQVILAQLPAKPVVVEIGAGNGHFIEALAQKNPQGRYIAFDPSGSMSNDGPVEFYAEYFDPAVHMAQFKPDLIICRHMLEHLENPLAFIQQLSFAAAWEGLDTAIFIEVPCIDRVLENGRTVDFFYEHNSHFTSQSLRRLLERSNAAVTVLTRGYEDEVVYGYARMGIQEASRPLTREAINFFHKAQAVDIQVQAQLKTLAESGKTVAFWGGTGKAATFLNRYGVDATRFPVVVDSDLDKVGTCVPGMGQWIQAPTVLLDQPVDVIVITTQWRAQDIALEIQRRGIRCTSLLLEYQGQLVEFYSQNHPYQTQPDAHNPARATG